MKPSNLILQLAVLVALSLGAQTMSGQAASRPEDAKPAAPCTLTLKDAPALLGMQLGMTLEQTRAAAPNLELSSRRRKPNGVSISLSARANEEAEGVVNSYLNDRLFEIDILYNSRSQWNSTADFVLNLSRKLNLPPDAWTRDAGKTFYTLTCDGFTIEVSNLNHVMLYDKAVKAEVMKRTN
jgi:hypothetical protein